MAKKSNAGRKPLWDQLDISSKLNAVTGWALEGSTDEDIYTMLGVNKDTFYKWKREKLEFAEALKKGREVANGELLNSAFKQATGFYQKVVKPMRVKVDQFTEEIEMVEVEEFIPPNNTMAIFMLKNRMPHKYKDKQQIEHSGVVGTMDLSYMEDDELEAELKRLERLNNGGSE